MWAYGQQMWRPRRAFTGRCWDLICGPPRSDQMTRIASLKMRELSYPWATSTIVYGCLPIRDQPRAMGLAPYNVRAFIISPSRFTQMLNLPPLPPVSTSLVSNWLYNLVMAIQI